MQIKQKAMSNATMHANRQRKCKQEIKKARHKMNGILYEFTENISCTASGRERTK